MKTNGSNESYKLLKKYSNMGWVYVIGLFFLVLSMAAVIIISARDMGGIEIGNTEKNVLKIAIVVFGISYLALVVLYFWMEHLRSKAEKVFNIKELSAFFDDLLNSRKYKVDVADNLTIFLCRIIKRDKRLEQIVKSNKDIPDDLINELKEDKEITKEHVLSAFFLRCVTYSKNGEIYRNSKILYVGKNFKKIIRDFAKALSDVKELERINTNEQKGTEKKDSYKELVTRCMKICSEWMCVREKGKEDDARMSNQGNLKEAFNKLAYTDSKKVKKVILNTLVFTLIGQVVLKYFKQDALLEEFDFMITILFEVATIILLHFELLIAEKREYIY